VGFRDTNFVFKNNTMIEIQTLNLRPGTREKFRQLYIAESLPLQRKWNIDVIAHGPSLLDENSYYVVRSFASPEDRKKKQDAFYNSDEWQKGPRTAVLGMIDNIAAIAVPAETFTSWQSLVSEEYSGSEKG